MKDALMKVADVVEYFKNSLGSYCPELPVVDRDGEKYYKSQDVKTVIMRRGLGLFQFHKLECVVIQYLPK